MYRVCVEKQSDPWWDNHANAAGKHTLIAMNRQWMVRGNSALLPNRALQTQPRTHTPGALPPTDRPRTPRYKPRILDLGHHP